MRTRGEYLAWCKARALEYVERGELADAVGSMLSDLTKWEGGPLYDDDLMQLVAGDAMLFCKTADQVRHWIEGFN